MDPAEDGGLDPEAAWRRARALRFGATLVQAQAGDRECLREIVAELTPMLWHVARAQGLAGADAEDVVQTVWLCLVSRLTAIKTPEALISWLTTAAKRESWRIRDAHGRVPPIASDAIPETVDPDESVEEQILAKERRQMVREGLERLPPRCTALLRELAYNEASYAEIGRKFVMPIGAIGPARGRCLAKLRTTLVNDPRWGSLCP